jgi:serine/threonine protein kinase
MTDDITALAKSQLFTLKGETVAVDLGADKGIARARYSHHASGEVIDQKYKIISLLGEGGMGAVYKAHHILLNKEMALKTFRSLDLSDQSLTRFQREAQAIARLTHTNVVQVFDFGVGEDNVPYYTMECLEGESLAERLAALDHLSVERTAQIFIQVCQGLSAAHNKGITHRDIKPGNIFLTQGSPGDSRSERVKIVDFGLASWASHSLEGQKLTSTGTIFGSPLYMSPEQSLGMEITERSDIYSCGCALFESLSGLPPFRGENAFATMLQHQSQPAPRIRSQQGEPEFSHRLIALVDQMLRKDPDKRIQTFDEVASELNGILKDIRTNRPTENRSSSKAAALDLEAPKQQRSRPVFTGPRLFTACSILGLGLVAAAVVVYQNLHPAPATKTPSENLISRNISRYLQNPSAGPSQSHRFHFPDNESLGDLKWAPIPGFPYDERSKPEDDSPAIGVRDVPPYSSVQLKAGKSVFEKPELLNGFAADDLEQLTLNSDYSWSDRHMSSISHLTGLRALIMNRADVTDNAFDDLNKLQNLRGLHIRFTKLHSSKVAHLKILPKLHFVSTSGSRDISIILGKLRNSQAIEYLQLDDCKLTDTDMKVIATMPNLKTLMIFKNDQITDRGLQSISKLSKLSELRIDHTGVSPNCIETLKNMQSLKKLNFDDWPAAQQLKLHQVLPHCQYYPVKSHVVPSLPAKDAGALDLYGSESIH